MALPTTIDIQTAFNLRVATPVFSIVDLTPFTTEGITLSNVKGNFKIVDPLGSTVYENTSTIAPDLKSFSISSITQTGGVATVTCATAHNMITGDYVLIAGASQSGYNIQGQITRLNTTQFTYLVDSGTVSPATGTILGLKMSLSASGAFIQIPLDGSTNLPLLGNYTITLTTIVAGGVQNGTYTKDFTYTYEYVRPTVSIIQAVNCFIARFTSTDATTYTSVGIVPTISRTQIITFPSESGIPNETFVTQKVQIDRPKVWNGIYITSISTNLSYTFNDDLIVLDTVSGSKPFEVSCQDICNINCCLNDANKAYKNALAAGGANSPVTVSKLAIFTRAMQLADLYQINIQCGNTADASQNLQDIYDVTGCTADCNCGSQGEVVPYDGFIGKTILEWDSELGNSQYDYINYNNTLYHVLQNTTAGQNPDDNPTLYQIIGSTSVWGSITGTLSNQTDLQAALDNKIDYFDHTNVSSGTTTASATGLSGRITFTGVAVKNDKTLFTINNTSVSSTKSVRLSLIYDPTGTGNLTLGTQYPTTNSVGFYIVNTSTSDDSNKDIIVDFQIMN